jgi:hypothetical protein
MTTLVNRAKMTTATTGTGTLTLGSASLGYQTFAAAGVLDGETVRYVIEEVNNWEIGVGTYTSSGTTLTRTPSESSSGGAAITLAGAAVVYVVAAAQDIFPANDVFYENNQSVTKNYTIAATKNAMSAGPVTVNAGVTVTVSSGARWVVL